MSSSSLRGQVRSGGWGSPLHSGVEFGRSGAGGGSSGGVGGGLGAAGDVLLAHIISARPPKQPLFFPHAA